MELPSSQGAPLLIAAAPGRTERLIAVSAVLLSFAITVAIAPVARIQLPVIPAFIALYQAALIIIDVVTAALLFGLFAQSRWVPLLVVATAYLFDGLMIVPHTLSYPGVFTPAGLIGAGPHTTAWLYIFWHGGFAAFILAYAVLRESNDHQLRSPSIAVVGSIAGVALLVVGFSVLTTVGHSLLPTLMRGNDYTLIVRKGISPTICLLTLCAFAALWRRRNRSILDLWLIVVLATWLCDVVLGAVVGASRFDLGFYAGRAFGLISSCFLLLMLLVEVVRLQAVLRDSERTLARMQHFEAIGKLTGGIAHDFNNLLTIIGGAAEMIRRSPGDRNRVARLCDNILQATQRGATVTHQLLTFARQEANHPATVNANRLLRGFEPLLHQAVGANIEVVFELSPVVDPVRIDATLFESAVLNLVVNAKDAMPNGGHIAVRTCNKTVAEGHGLGEIPAGDYVLIEIADDGIGMTAEVLAQAVNPFFTTKEFGRGSGMGLSQVYGFVRTFEGFLHMESERGKGTKVAMYLPKAMNGHATEPVLDRMPVRRAVQANETVLIVEDEPEVLALARDALTELGYRVLIAEDAEQAVELLKGDARIDILFSDIVMPGRMNGAQLAVEARKVRPGIKVLLTTGYAPEMLKGHGVPGDAQLLQKPYQSADLANRLRLVSENPRPARSM